MVHGRRRGGSGGHLGVSGVGLGRCGVGMAERAQRPCAAANGVGRSGRMIDVCRFAPFGSTRGEQLLEPMELLPLRSVTFAAGSTPAPPRSD
jgi:hypothetical protein